MTLKVCRNERGVSSDKEALIGLASAAASSHHVGDTGLSMASNCRSP
jgi:hypothetical protein